MLTKSRSAIFQICVIVSRIPDWPAVFPLVMQACRYRCTCSTNQLDQNKKRQRPSFCGSATRHDCPIRMLHGGDTEKSISKGPGPDGVQAHEADLAQFSGKNN
jgi:hypothetical protein